MINNFFNAELCGFRKVKSNKCLLISAIFAAFLMNAGSVYGIGDYEPVATSPTLDVLNAQGETALDSVYTLEETDAPGAGVYNFKYYDEETGTVMDKYYRVQIKAGAPASNAHLTNDADLSGANHMGHYYNLIRNAAGSHNVGAGIYNRISAAKFADIISDFINNRDVSTGAYISHGGGLDNHGQIHDVIGDFIGNYVDSEDRYSGGGAIHNITEAAPGGTIHNIYGNFIGNYARSTNDYSRGGAIYNNLGTIDNIYANFIDNKVLLGDNTSGGGGIYNRGTIGTVNGTFIGNSVENGSGGGMFNSNEIGDINADFIANTAPIGGGISNANGGTITNVVGNFKANTAVNGGAIYNDGDIDTINAQFTGNTATDGGAIYNNDGNIVNITGSFKNNVADNGGAIYNNTGTIENINVNFVGVEAAVNGGAIHNESGDINNIVGNFRNNSADKGGAIYNNDGNIGDITGDFVGNTAANGGAIYNESGVIGDINGNIRNNSAVNELGVAHGGAIYNGGEVSLISDGTKHYIKGNTVTDQNGTRPEAIYMSDAASVLNIKTANNGEWEIDDKINGVAGYTVNMIGDETGKVSLFNDMVNANVNLNSTTLNTINNNVHVYDFNSFTVNGNSAMTVDVNLAKQKMDRITADAYGAHTGTLNVNGMNLLTDTNRPKVSILFAQEGLAQRVRNFGKPVGSTQKVYTPIRAYNLQYNIHNDDHQGYFEFSKPSNKTGNIIDDYNPAALAGPVLVQAGAQAAFNTTMMYAFNHLDTYTKIPSFDRIALMNRNKYAFASTDFNQNTNYNLRAVKTDNNGVWFRPYTAFETIPIKNGPKIDSLTYGAFLGYDSDFRQHSHGWNSVWSFYAGYHGGQLDYKNVNMSLNGGTIGITDTFYKGNFWTALTAAGGAILGNASTWYGSEDTSSIVGGIASKTGYNIEFKDGRFIMQPIFKMSYSITNTFDYTNSAGLRVDSSPLHTIQLHPSLRFIGNLNNGWQPYASAGMVWNLLNETDVTLGGYQLPDMHIKPYVEYGLGLQKLYNHRFMGFGQAMVRHGGRNGVALTFGFRYSLGDEGNDKNVSRTTLKK